MLKADKIRANRFAEEVDTMISASLQAETSTGEERDVALNVIQSLIPKLRELDIWTGGESLQSAKTLATMVAGLEGKKSL